MFAILSARTMPHTHFRHEVDPVGQEAIYPHATAAHTVAELKTDDNAKGVRELLRGPAFELARGLDTEQS